MDAELIERWNAELIERWNRKVHRNDTVYIVGDFIFRCHRPPEEYFDLLKGKKHLILGNHDKYWLKKVEVEKHLESVSPMHRGNSWVYDHHDAAIKKLDKILAESGDSEAS